MFEFSKKATKLRNRRDTMSNQIDEASEALLNNVKIFDILTDPVIKKSLWFSIPFGERNYINSSYISSSYEVISSHSTNQKYDRVFKLSDFLFVLKSFKFFFKQFLMSLRNVLYDKKNSSFNNATIIITHQNRLRAKKNLVGMIHDHFSSFDFLTRWLSYQPIIFLHFNMNDTCIYKNDLIKQLNASKESDNVMHRSVSECVSVSLVISALIDYLKIIFPILNGIIRKKSLNNLPTWIGEILEAERDFMNSILGPGLFRTVLSNKIWRELFRTNGIPCKIFYPFENLYWEHSMLNSIIGTKCETVGLLLGTIGVSDLRYVFSRKLKNLEKTQSFPSKLAVNSKKIIPLLLGGPPIFEIEALRYPIVKKETSETLSSNNYRLLVICDINNKISADMLQCVKELDMFSKYEVLVKRHNGAKPGLINVEYLEIDKPLTSLVCQSDFVVVSANTGAIIDCLYLKPFHKILIFLDGKESFGPFLDFDNLTFVNDAVSLSKAMMEDGNINENNNTLEFEYFNFCDNFFIFFYQKEKIS